MNTRGALPAGAGPFGRRSIISQTFIRLSYPIQTCTHGRRTADHPPYMEDRWALLADNQLPIDVFSLKMIGLDPMRWLRPRRMSEADFSRKFIHPEKANGRCEGALALYAWHSQHHTAHITKLRERNGWWRLPANYANKRE